MYIYTIQYEVQVGPQSLPTITSSKYLEKLDWARALSQFMMPRKFLISLTCQNF